ncbi:MAG: porin family protein [Chlorobiales bacterium]|nr:porin family protein [Chlorobiales bacterium]
MKRLLLIVALLCSFVFNTAKAAEDQGGWSLGALAGYGFGSDFKTTLDTKAPSIWRFGFGARLGYSFESGLYLGATGMYHLGESSSATVAGVSYKVSVKPIYVGGELGLTLLRGQIISIRPYVGAGYTIFKPEKRISGGGVVIDINTSDSKSYFTVNPGVLGMVYLGQLYVGADLRYYLVTGTESGFDANAFGFYVTLGIGI